MKAFEIFRPGKFTAMDGQQVEFTEAMLAEVASSYQPDLHEAPLVVGHPKSDAPAYGWVRGLTYEKSRLVADPDQLDPAFAEMVEAGRFKKRSASFYPPAHAANPTPGKWHLKHVGFLGALPPAVKGLKPVSFAGEEDGLVTFEFGEADRAIGWSLRSIADLARRFREYVLVKDGQDEADRLVPSYVVDEIASSAARITEQAQPDFSEPNPEDNLKLTQEQLDAKAAELDAREASLKTKETEVGAREASFSEAEKKTRRIAHGVSLDALIAAGKLAPALKAEALDFLDGLDAVTVVEFGEGDAKAKKTPSAWFLDLLSKSGTIVDFSERAVAEDAKKEGAVSFAAPADMTVDAESLKIHQRAVAYQASHPNASYTDALTAIGAF